MKLFGRFSEWWVLLKNKILKTFGYFQYIIDNLIPFESCSNEDIIPHLLYERMDVNKFMKHLEILTK